LFRCRQCEAVLHGGEFEKITRGRLRGERKNVCRRCEAENRLDLLHREIEKIDRDRATYAQVEIQRMEARKQW